MGVGGGVVSGGCWLVGACSWAGEWSGVWFWRVRVGVVLLASVLVLVGWVGFVFLACARVGLRACVWFLGVVRVPRVWLFGCRKAGREPVVWFSPRFFFFCVGRMAGVGPAAFALGG